MRSTLLAALLVATLSPSSQAMTARGNPGPAITGPMAGEPVSSGFSEGLRLAREGRLEAGIRALEAAIGQNPDNGGAYYVLGLAHAKKGALPEAAAALHRALEITPSLPGVSWALGLVLSQQHRWPEAAAVLRQASVLAPAEGAIQHDLGLALAHDGQAAAAIAAFRKTLEIVPAHPRAAIELADLLRSLGRHDEAASVLSGSDGLHPGNARMEEEIGDGLMSQGRRQEAISRFRAAIAKGGPSARLSEKLANALYLEGRRQEATALFKQAVSLRTRPVTAMPGPDRFGTLLAAVTADGPKVAAGTSAAYTKAGITLMQQKEYPTAIASFQAAVRHNPANADAQRLLGNALYLTGRHAEAVTAFRASVGLKPLPAPAGSESHVHIAGMPCALCGCTVQ